MSISDEYEAIYRRIEDLAGIDRTPRLLEQINALDLTDYDKRLYLLLDIGYKPANYPVWGNLSVFTQCEWTNLLFGLEPMKADIQFPSPDDFDVLIRTVDAWLIIHRLVGDQFGNVRPARSNPEVIKRDRLSIPNNSYTKSDLITATRSASLPISCHIEHPTNKSLRSRGEQPIWILRKSAGGFWEVGNEANPETLKAVTAFMDIAYAIGAEGRDFSPLKLPGNQSEEGDKVGANSPSLSENGLETSSIDGKPSDDRSWTGFGSDDVADAKARRNYKHARQKLLDDIEIAHETGNSAEEDEAQGRLDELELFMNETTMPGGKSRKLSAGDPIEKATANARDRKSTAIKKIEEAGLHDMAKHLKDCYLVKKREVAYIKGHPFPEWLI